MPNQWGLYKEGMRNRCPERSTACTMCCSGRSRTPGRHGIADTGVPADQTQLLRKQSVIMPKCLQVEHPLPPTRRSSDICGFAPGQKEGVVFLRSGPHSPTHSATHPPTHPHTTMTTATGLHAAEIVPPRPKDLLPFEAKVVRTIWGPSRPGRAKEVIFTLLCKGHSIAPTLVQKYSRILWLVHLCHSGGAGLITAQAIWETGAYKHDTGPFGCATQTVQDCGWAALQGR